MFGGFFCCLIILVGLFVFSFLRIIYWLAFIRQPATESVFKSMLTFLFYSYPGHLGDLSPSFVLSCQCLKKLETQEDAKIRQVKTNTNSAQGSFQSPSDLLCEKQHWFIHVLCFGLSAQLISHFQKSKKKWNLSENCPWQRLLDFFLLQSSSQSFFSPDRWDIHRQVESW